MYFHKFNDQKGGTVLLMTLMVLMAVLAVTMAISDIIRNGLLASRTQADSTLAYFASEAGAERILWEARKNGHIPSAQCAVSPAKICFTPGNIWAECATNCTNPNIATTTLSNQADYYIDYSYAAPTTTLSVFGEYKGLRRKIELKY